MKMPLKNKHILFLMFLMVLPILVSCSSLQVVSTPPEADVFIETSAGTRSDKPICSTPCVIEEFPKGDFFFLIFEKKGYGREKILLSKPGILEFRTTVETAMIYGASQKKMNAIVNNMLNARKFIDNGQLGEALAAVENVITEDNEFAKAYALKGTIHYLKKELDLAKAAWRKTLELDPSDVEALNMLQQMGMPQ